MCSKEVSVLILQVCKVQWAEKGDSCENRAGRRSATRRLRCVAAAAAAGLNRAEDVKLTLEKVTFLKLSQTATFQVTVPLQKRGTPH